MANKTQFEFVQQLGADLNAGKVKLPSLPDVIIKIRDLLEDDVGDFEDVSKVVSIDTALVSKLFLFANSAYHNRQGEKIANIEAAIAKLGLELVRSTAMALAIKQLAFAKGQSHIKQFVKKIWSRSIQLASMSHALAGQREGLNQETAFMCGLLHDIGKLYVLTKAKDNPDFATNSDWFEHVFAEWSPQIGRSIVEAWGFPDEVVESLEPGEFLDEHASRPPRMVDVVFLAGQLIDDGESNMPEILALTASRKLKISEESIVDLRTAYEEKYANVKQSLA